MAVGPVCCAVVAGCVAVVAADGAEMGAFSAVAVTFAGFLSHLWVLSGLVNSTLADGKLGAPSFAVAVAVAMVESFVCRFPLQWLLGC